MTEANDEVPGKPELASLNTLLRLSVSQFYKPFNQRVPRIKHLSGKLLQHFETEAPRRQEGLEVAVRPFVLLTIDNRNVTAVIINVDDEIENKFPVVKNPIVSQLRLGKLASAEVEAL